MEHTTLVQHIRQQEKATPGATGEFTSLMNEIMVAAKIISLEVNSAGIGEDIFGLTDSCTVDFQRYDFGRDHDFIHQASELAGSTGSGFLLLPDVLNQGCMFHINPILG